MGRQAREPGISEKRRWGGEATARDACGVCFRSPAARVYYSREFQISRTVASPPHRRLCDWTVVGFN
ncbi:hypothetical protein LQZ19_11825 [Treponema primitia]|uniref:hypothetical protein n=1 Tax=Treponema primitia TaxID=88058 RepID=UPI00397EC746